MIIVIFWFIVVWILGFILHEFFHLFAAKLQGCDGKIELWFHNGIPSLRYRITDGSPGNIGIIDFVGGLGTSAVLFIMAGIMYFVYEPLMIACFLVGSVNLTYGLYEGFMIRRLTNDPYMKWHYVVYAVTLVVGIIIVVI